MQILNYKLKEQYDFITYNYHSFALFLKLLIFFKRSQAFCLEIPTLILFSNYPLKSSFRLANHNVSKRKCDCLIAIILLLATNKTPVSVLSCLCHAIFSKAIYAYASFATTNPVERTRNRTGGESALENCTPRVTFTVPVPLKPGQTVWLLDCWHR